MIVEEINSISPYTPRNVDDSTHMSKVVQLGILADKKTEQVFGFDFTMR